jgi:hypothetical protein
MFDFLTLFQLPPVIRKYIGHISTWLFDLLDVLFLLIGGV